MDVTTVVVFGVFGLIVVGYGVYNHYKNKARRLKKKAEGEDTSGEPSAPVSGGGASGKTDHVAQQAK